MKKYKGAVFFDYDGTLVDEVDHIKTVTPKTLTGPSPAMEAMRKWTGKCSGIFILRKICCMKS